MTYFYTILFYIKYSFWNYTLEKKNDGTVKYLSLGSEEGYIIYIISIQFLLMLSQNSLNYVILDY